MLNVEVRRSASLRFDHGSQVRAASAMAPFAGSE
jgi:hypothetical protein